MALDRHVYTRGLENDQRKDMTTAIAIFVKTPTLSPVKTRLAATIGKKKAMEFYGLCLNAVRETVEKLDATPFWAVGEESGLINPLWQDFNRLYTGGGGLGERQHYIYQTLQAKYDRVILIGADVPQLSRTLLQEAITGLDKHNFVIGPARDGGYYLFGGRTPVHKDIWMAVPYSVSGTRKKLESLLPSTQMHLPLLTDVDTEDDFVFIPSEMPTEMMLAQYEVVRWISEYKKERIIPLHR
jgi:rSAM/selenodomain-associated transferase 1